MVYFGKKQSGNLTNYYTKTEADNRYARLASPNTFTATNTFNVRINSNKGFETNTNNADIMKLDYQQEKSANVVYKQSTGGYKNYCNMKYLWTNNDTAYTNLLTFIFKPDTSVNEVEFNSGLGSFSFNKKVNFKSDIELKSPTSNNGAFLTNFQYQNQNLTSLKFVKNPSKAMLILEVNNDTETAKIETPNQQSGLSIKNLKNPTDNNDAANKAYVDSRTKTYYWTGNVAINNTQNLETISWDKHIIGAVVFRKRSDNQWFCINNNMTQQLYRDNGTGQFKLYGNNATGTPTFTDEYRVYITYIN